MRNLYYTTLEKFSGIFKALISSKLRVLAYHDVVDPTNFEKQLIYLKNNYNIIDINSLEKHLYHDYVLPERSILITFDDGDYSLFEIAIPILEKYKIPTCVFVITELIDSNDDFWWNRIRTSEKLNGSSPMEISNKINEMKSMPNHERMQEIAKYEQVERKQLTTGNLTALENSGMLIANHSHTHPMFDKCSKAELQEEMDQTNQFFRKYSSGRFDVFAYPNGNYDKNSEECLLNNNIKMAFLFDHKINDHKINPLRISRIRVDSDTAMDEYKVKVSGLHPYIYNKMK